MWSRLTSSLATTGTTPAVAATATKALAAAASTTTAAASTATRNAPTGTRVGGDEAPAGVFSGWLDSLQRVWGSTSSPPTTTTTATTLDGDPSTPSLVATPLAAVSRIASTLLVKCSATVPARMQLADSASLPTTPSPPPTTTTTTTTATSRRSRNCTSCSPLSWLGVQRRSRCSCQEQRLSGDSSKGAAHSYLFAAPPASSEQGMPRDHTPSQSGSRRRSSRRFHSGGADSDGDDGEQQEQQQQPDRSTSHAMVTKTPGGKAKATAAAKRYHVYVGKRPIVGTTWTKTLTRLGQEHVGVMLVAADAASASGLGSPSGSAKVHSSLGCDDAAALRRRANSKHMPPPALTYPGLPQPRSSKGKEQPDVVSFDFGPAGGHDFSLLAVMPAEIRTDHFLGGEFALVGTATTTVDAVEAFNKRHAAEYQCGVTDCRDYVTALVKHLTRVHIEPSHVSHYVDAVRGRGAADTHASQQSVASAAAAASSTPTVRRAGVPSLGLGGALMSWLWGSFVLPSGDGGSGGGSMFSPGPRAPVHLSVGFR